MPTLSRRDGPLFKVDEHAQVFGMQIGIVIIPDIALRRASIRGRFTVG